MNVKDLRRVLRPSARTKLGDETGWVTPLIPGKDPLWPGWYRAPDGARRYWNGHAWTESVPAGSKVPVYGPAIVSLVIGVLSVVPPLFVLAPITGSVGMALGGTSLKHCQPEGQWRGRWMAWTGIILSGLGIVLCVWAISQLGSAL